MIFEISSKKIAINKKVLFRTNNKIKTHRLTQLIIIHIAHTHKTKLIYLELIVILVKQKKT